METQNSAELSAFATTWVERWLHHGGGVSLAPDGGLVIGCRVNADDSPAYVPPPSDLPAAVAERRYWFDDGFHTGATRELLALLKAVPGARDALATYVAAQPGRAVYRERKDA